MLKSCPFCGGEQVTTAPGAFRRWFVVCKACGATANSDDGEPQAIAAWNQRSPAQREGQGAVERVIELRDALAAAYEAGASDVHRHWQENPGDAPGGDPEFGEAASDYAAAALNPLSSAARGVSFEFLAALTEREA